jgi:SAM-dependent methyltransferase
MESYKKSYQNQIEHLKKYPEESCKHMLDHNTINRWRFDRFYVLLDPLLELFPNSEWLTVGDFYYGTDAEYIKSKGHKVVASDIDDHFLKKGKEIGYIDAYSKENLESLSFKDESFDFVLCKETFHHLPRPYVGLYEMLRVSKFGVVLLEPFDRKINVSLVMSFAEWLLKKFKGETYNRYEISGNYKYSLSKNEIEKIALGLNYPLIAFKYLNDYYRAGLGIEIKNKNDKLIKKVKRQILLRDILWKFKIFPPTYLMSIIFKKEINLTSLKKENFEVFKLTRNPYLKD